MLSKPLLRRGVPLALVLSLPIGLTAGREVGGDPRIPRIAHGGAAGVVVDLVVVGLFALAARHAGRDVS
jgi:hypothetical protein